MNIRLVGLVAGALAALRAFSLDVTLAPAGDIRFGDDKDCVFRTLVERFYAGGGVAMNITVVSPETLRDAQKHPENYRDLVVRVAGFSAYFVEVFKNCQDDLISRTEMAF